MRIRLKSVLLALESVSIASGRCQTDSKVIAFNKCLHGQADANAASLSSCNFAT